MQEFPCVAAQETEKCTVPASLVDVFSRFTRVAVRLLHTLEHKRDGIANCLNARRRSDLLRLSVVEGALSLVESLGVSCIMSKVSDMDTLLGRMAAPHGVPPRRAPLPSQLSQVPLVGPLF